MSLSNVSNNNAYSSNNRNKYAVSINGIALFNNNENEYRSGIGFSMWNNMLKIYIIPFDETEGRFNTSYLANHACIFLSQTKAIMLSELLKKFKKDREKYNGYGVKTSKSIITINNGTRFNSSIDKTAIRIIKFNYDDNMIDNEGAYQLKSDYYAESYINNVSNNNGIVEYDKIETPNFKDIELDLIINQIDEFIKATTNAYAYSTSQAMEYNIRTIKESLDDLSR